MTSLSLQETVKNTVKEAADIVEVIGEHVALKRAGLRYTGLCPFHGEKTPSFSVNPQGQFYYCFGCGASGDVFSFVMQYHHIDFPEALKQLAGRYHIDLPERQMSAAEQELDAKVVRDELGRILACVDFDASERNRHFLRYVVEETLAGRAER